MNKTIFETIEESCRILQLPFSSKEFAELAEENAMSEDATQAVAFILEHIQQKKAANTILALLRFSRLPVKTWIAEIPHYVVGNIFVTTVVLGEPITV